MDIFYSMTPRYQFRLSINVLSHWYMIKIIPAYNIGIKVIKFKFSLIVRTFEIQNGENLDILFDLVKWKTPES